MEEAPMDIASPDHFDARGSAAYDVLDVRTDAQLVVELQGYRDMDKDRIRVRIGV
jgi:hypothetical protein